MLSASSRAVTREQWDHIIHSWGDHLLRYIGCDPVVENPENVSFDSGEPLILMSNHTSLYDIPIIFRAVPGPVRMVTKKELRGIPFFGKTLEILEFIYIDRKNRSQAIQDLERAREKMQSGILVWISPEGTRSKTGRLQPLKKGGFKIAQQTGARIVPISIQGADQILKDNSLFNLHMNVPVRVKIGKPIDPNDYVGRENGEREFMDAIAKKIAPDSTDL